MDPFQEAELLPEEGGPPAEFVAGQVQHPELPQVRCRGSGATVVPPWCFWGVKAVVPVERQHCGGQATKNGSRQLDQIQINYQQKWVVSSSHPKSTSVRLISVVLWSHLCTSNAFRSARKGPGEKHSYHCVVAHLGGVSSRY